MAGKALRCPNCGATQKGKVETEQATVVCPYCQTQVLVPQALRGSELSASSGHPLLWVVLGITGVTAVGVAVLTFVLLGRNTAEAETTAAAPSTAAMAPTPPSAAATAPPPAVDSAVVSSFGEPGKQPGQLNDARAIAVDSQGTIYVADFAPPRLQKFNRQGKYLARIDLGDVERKTLTDMALGLEDILYVVVGGAIHAVSKDGVHDVLAPAKKQRHFRTLTVDSSGTLIASALAGKETDIVKLNRKGIQVAQYKAPFSKIYRRVLPALEVDEAGNIYALPRLRSEMLVLDKKGEYVNRINTSQLCGAGSIKPMSKDREGNLVFGASNALTVCTTAGKKLRTIQLPKTTGSVRGLAVGPDGNAFVTTNAGRVLEVKLRP